MFYIDQILFVLIAYISAQEEINGTWAFRTYASPGTIQSKLYHRWGFVHMAFVGVITAWAFHTTLLDAAYLAVLNAFIYWLLFDIWYAKGINKDWWYLGGEADLDKKLINKGKLKAYICLAIIITINIVKLIWHK